MGFGALGFGAWHFFGTHALAGQGVASAACISSAIRGTGSDSHGLAADAQTDIPDEEHVDEEKEAA